MSRPGPRTSGSKLCSKQRADLSGSRGVSLWALMHAGHAISCFMLRQMEYDADSYEAKLAGSDTFESTIERLPVLSVAMQFALEDLRRSWVSSRLAEDLPLLIDHKATSLPAEVHQQLAAARASTKTGWFQTH